MRKSCYFLMLLAIATFFVTCKPEPEPEPEPEPTYNLTFWTNEDLDGVIVVNLYDNGGYDKEGYISKVYSYTPDCGDNGCATFKDLDPGRYYYYATCGYYEWEGEVNVTEPIPNLLLTGQSLNLHGILGVSMTSFLTCAEILGMDKINEELKIKD